MSNKKILITISAGLIAAIFVTTNLAAAADLHQALSTLPQDEEWSIMAYASLGQSVGREYLSAPINSASATDYEKRILASEAAGYNPATVSSENFVAKLESLFDGSQLGDPELINDDIFGILALHAAGTGDNIVANSRQFILNHQNSDGGWGFALGTNSDSNTTAMAVAALSLDGSVPASALNYLQQSQDSSGGFGFSPGQAADGASTAWVISGLTTAGQSVPMSAKNFLESLQLPDGAFKWHPADATGSTLVTAYAVIALSGQSVPLVGQANDEPGSNAPTPTPTAPETTPTPPSPAARRISSIAPTHAAAGTWITITGTNLSDLWRGSTTVQFFNAAGGRATYVGSLESNLTISRFQIPATLPPGRYTVKVGPNLDDVSNAISFTVDQTASSRPTTPTPIVGAANSTGLIETDCIVPIYHTNFPLNGGSVITVDGQLYYVKNYLAQCAQAGSGYEAASPTPTPVVGTTSSTSLIETDCIVPIYHTNFPLNGGSVITVDGQLYYVKSYLPQCQDITAANAVTAAAPRTSPPANPAPTPTPPPVTAQTVALSVRYNSTNIFSGAITYSSQSALSLLLDAGREHSFNVSTTSTALGQFVSAIAGKGPSGANGWQYAVNGRVPTAGAADYVLHAGDSVQWFYGAPQTSPY